MKLFRQGKTDCKNKYLVVLIFIFVCSFISVNYGQAKNDTSKVIVTAKDFLKDILYTRQEIDEWLAGEAFPFAILS